MSLRRWFALIVFVSLAVRFALWLAYPLTTNNDSATYLQLAKNMLNKGFRVYNATRTPGYPGFLAISGDFTYPAQLALGVLTTLLIFYIAWKISGKAWFAALAALAHTLNLGQLFFEAALLTETLTTFLVAASFAAVLACGLSKGWLLSLTLALLGGLAAGLAALTRPLFVFLPILLAFYALVGFTDRNIFRRTGFAAAALLPAFILVGWWLNFVQVNYKIWNFDTISGYRWLNHTGGYFELVPDEHAAIRDTYIRYRDAQIADTGTQTNAVWGAMDELMRASRLNFFQLSRRLAQISYNLILAHPWLYLQNVLAGWWMFWWAAIYWQPAALAWPGMAPVLRFLILAERGLLILTNFAFVGASFPLVFSKKLRAALVLPPFLWLVAASIWAASILQALTDHGDNPRYLIPMQSLVALVVAWGVVQYLKNRRRTLP